MAAKPTARKTAKSRARRPKTANLHDPSIDPKGRVDVLAARALRLLVQKLGDVNIQTLYNTFQADIDRVIAKELGGLNAGELLGGGLQMPKVVRP